MATATEIKSMIGNSSFLRERARRALLETLEARNKEMSYAEDLRNHTRIAEYDAHIATLCKALL